MLGNIKASLVGTYCAVRKKHMVHHLAEFEWCFNNRFDLAAMPSMCIVRVSGFVCALS